MRKLLRFNNMNKYSLISIIAIVVIVIPILYGVWSVYSVEQLQFRTEKQPFSYFDFSSSEKIRVCNPTPFFVTFSGITIDVYYLNDIKGNFEIGPSTLDPNSFEILDADFSAENFSEAQYLFMHMDGQFDGEVPIRLDPGQMKISTTYETKLIGIIPIEQTVTQSGLNFTQMMNKSASCEKIN